MKLLELNDKILIIDKKIKITITKKNFKDNLKFFSINQIHSDKFYFINKKNIQRNLKGDAIITNIINFPVAVKTADCLPIFVYSKYDNIISVIHAGWRGTSKKIFKKVLDFLIYELNLSLHNLNFIFGPSICNKCYIVKNDMKEAFLKNFGDRGEKFFKKISQNEFLFDLKGANWDILDYYNVDNSRIFDLNKCTVCNNNDFYSFRKENTDKRIFNLIEILEV